MVKVLFGPKALHSGYCPICDDASLGGDDMKCCDCGCLLLTQPGLRREVAFKQRRRSPSKKYEIERIAAQENRCQWCAELFGSLQISPRHTVQRLRITWDHFVPYAYTGSCDDLEFVASCHVCNGIKHSDMFDSEDECRAYLKRRRHDKGWVSAE